MTLKRNTVDAFVTLAFVGIPLFTGMALGHWAPARLVDPIAVAVMVLWIITIALAVSWLLVLILIAIFNRSKNGVSRIEHLEQKAAYRKTERKRYEALWERTRHENDELKAELESLRGAATEE